MEEEVVDKKDRRGQEEKTHLIEKYSGRRYPRHRLFPSADEAVGTDYGIRYLLYPQPLCQPATTD